MNRAATTYTLHAPSHIRTAGTGGRCAYGYLQTPEITYKNHPNSRSNFTGKERDEETGYSYFGARYMDHELTTMWLSVDPMADKYPGISPYNYCMWNPIKLVDPDGREADNPPTSLVYAIQKGDNFWNLENAWNIPHGTLQRINPSADPHDLKEGQVINAARMEGSLLVVGDNVVIQEEREPDFSYDDGYSGFMLVAPSSDFLTFRMVFDGLCYDLTWAFGGDAKKAGSALRKLSTRNSSWCYGHHHGMRKWNNEFIKRGWTEKQVTRTIEKGKPTAAENRVNPGNKATRYTNRNTGKALTLDRVTRELIQVGASDFEY